MAKRRVVVTGMGAVTPIGLSVDEFWQSINCLLYTSPSPRDTR